jgi:DNA-binding transcriptional regulator LsrR (DeoR family)
MLTIDQRMQRLVRVATMYYERDMTQNDIAEQLQISRPMISKLLKEAKELGIVHITINQKNDAQQMLSDQLCGQYALKKAYVVKAERSAAQTNEKIAMLALSLLVQRNEKRQKVGIGWGSLVGKLVECLEASKSTYTLNGDVFPLIGGVKASYRSYHTNELARVISDKTGLSASYLYIPAIFDSEEEKSLYEKTEIFKSMEAFWSGMTVGIVNISHYPSSPDLATAIRFGNMLQKKHAVGSFLANYFNADGEIIAPVRNIIMQISIDQLKAADSLFALCKSILTPESAIGALRTGLFSHVILSDELAVQLLQHK